MIMKQYILLLVGLIAAVTICAQGYKTDFIRYLHEDGISYKDYTKVVSKRQNSWHYIEKGRTPDEVFSFTSPRDYDFQALLDEKYNRISFNSGSFSLIREDQMTDEDLIIKDGLYIFQNDYLESRDGYYGFCAAVPEGFEDVNYVWVFPEKFEVVDFEANVNGVWKLIDNTLSFTAQEVNNILFKISYKIKETKPLEITGRDVVLKDTLDVTNRIISISIWDDSKVDNDIISLKINDEWLVKYLEAKQEKTTFKYVLTQPENYIILRADNIGEIPPNTTAVEINDGKNTYRAVLNSDLGMSEAIKVNLKE